MRFLVLVLALGFIASPARAIEENQFRFGGHAGHVGLLQDTGSRSGNAVGYGVEFGYAASSEMVLNLGYTTIMVWSLAMLPAAKWF